MTAPLRTRFAPSPTGSLHVGGVRTALYCLLEAHGSGGHFLLRIEDTDQARSTEEAANGILRDMRWLDLLWDEGPGTPDQTFGPFFQSQRLDRYRACVQQLLDEGKAYEAWESREELDVERKHAEAAKENFRYRRRPYTADQIAAWRDEGRLPVVRFATPRKPVTVVDRILGEVTVDEDTVDDFVILKDDGFPTYHFAVVVDDHDMQIDLVLRGQEHLMNTHKHLLLYEAFGWRAPQHGHLPLIFNPTGQKMSKRDKARVAREKAREKAKSTGADAKTWTWLAEEAGIDREDLVAFMAKKHDGVSMAEAVARATGATLPLIEVNDFRRDGYLPEAIVNYLCLLGWSPGDDREVLTRDEMVAVFSIDRVQKTAARFDADKLLWMNQEYMKSLPEDTLLEHLGEWLDAVHGSPLHALDEAGRRAMIRMYRPRARTFEDLHRLGGFLFVRPTTWAEKQVKKHVLADGGVERLRATRDTLSAQEDFGADALAAMFQRLADDTGLGFGKVAQPVRVAVSGDGVSPEIQDTLAFLGRTETLARIDAFLVSLS